MFKVINISGRSLVIGGVRINNMGEFTFDSNIISTTTKQKINSLARLNLIKVVAIQKQKQPETIVNDDTEKKSTRKSK